MKLEEEVDLTGTGETNEGSHGKQEGAVQERKCRATRPGQQRKENTMKKPQEEEHKIENSQENIRQYGGDDVLNVLPRAKQNGEKPKILRRAKAEHLAVVIFSVLFTSKAAEGCIVSAGIAHWMAGKEIPIMLLSCHA